ncbi:MAG: Xaa-Pro aminopeptidase [Paracoccaceae bacterium]|jgi:Xaa-Pro aminopeptidase
MLQTFTTTAETTHGPARLTKLRHLLSERGFDGFLVPRADAHQCEYVSEHDERLAYISGFTGSAGFLVVLPKIAGVFIDGRYRTQVKGQVDLNAFTPVDWPETNTGKWVLDHLPKGRLAYDPWLHTPTEIENLSISLEQSDVELCPSDNFVDRIWLDQPAPPLAPIFIQPYELAGQSMAEKKAKIAQVLVCAGADCVALTLPDSLCWLLNLRGGDVARNPIMHGFALLWADGRFDFFVDAAKISDDVRIHLGADSTIHPPQAFEFTLRSLKGCCVMLDPATAPMACLLALNSAGVRIMRADDPCLLPKACKNSVEIAATSAAHLRDGAAVCAFLHWLDNQSPDTGLSEIDVVKSLECFRIATNCLHDLSFDTICGAGPNGAIMHYRVTEKTNRTLVWGEPLLVDSGGQYQDGTTDITRTIAIGAQTDEVRAVYTRVLQGLIAISRIRFPEGIAGCHIDALARAPLWFVGQDFDHGTGHGVGIFLSVHEGPQRISRLSQVPLKEGMILSNEPGYYRPGSFGVRLENLITVTKANPMKTADCHRIQLAFETLTFVPFDRRMIDKSALAWDEVTWLNSYHLRVRNKIAPLLESAPRDWLMVATEPL